MLHGRWISRVHYSSLGYVWLVSCKLVQHATHIRFAYPGRRRESFCLQRAAVLHTAWPMQL
jgi:hypothetical protein